MRNPAMRPNIRLAVGLGKAGVDVDRGRTVERDEIFMGAPIQPRPRQRRASRVQRRGRAGHGDHLRRVRVRAHVVCRESNTGRGANSIDLRVPREGLWCLTDSGRDLPSQPTLSRLENAPRLRGVIRLTQALVDTYRISFIYLRHP